MKKYVIVQFFMATLLCAGSMNAMMDRVRALPGAAWGAWGTAVSTVMPTAASSAAANLARSTDQLQSAAVGTAFSGAAGAVNASAQALGAAVEKLIKDRNAALAICGGAVLTGGAYGLYQWRNACNARYDASQTAEALAALNAEHAKCAGLQQRFDGLNAEHSAILQEALAALEQQVGCDVKAYNPEAGRNFDSYMDRYLPYKPFLESEHAFGAAVSDMCVALGDSNPKAVEEAHEKFLTATRTLAKSFADLSTVCRIQGAGQVANAVADSGLQDQYQESAVTHASRSTELTELRQQFDQLKAEHALCGKGEVLRGALAVFDKQVELDVDSYTKDGGKNKKQQYRLDQYQVFQDFLKNLSGTEPNLLGQVVIRLNAALNGEVADKVASAHEEFKVAARALKNSPAFAIGQASGSLEE